jgi:hypothetical protein
VAGPVFNSPTPPPNPGDGDLWFNTTTGREYVWYISPSLIGQWVQTQPTSSAVVDATVVPPVPPIVPSAGPHDVTRTPTLTVSQVPPTSPAPLPGDLWWNTINGNEFILYDDGNTVQWVLTHRGNGPIGPKGDQGDPGADGADGADGAQGPQGNTGLQGAQGVPGPQGDVGPMGPQGVQGPVGPVGPIGPTGADSTVPGPQGPQGIQGPVGPTGADSTVPGPQGPQGVQGPIGLTGATGAASTVPGPKGDKGDTGAQGVQGPAGAASTVPGPQGPQGPIGPTGATGADSTVPGPQGPAGAAGAQGIQGVKGDKGDPGVQGIQGVKGDTGAQGIQGPQGVQGVQGTPGPLPTTGTVPPGSPVDSQLWWNSDGTPGGGQLYIRYNDGNTVQWVPAAPATASAPTGLLGSAFAVINTLIGISDGNGIMPADDTIPQIGEGYQILVANYTPKSAASKLRLRAFVRGNSNSTLILCAAIFRDAIANAVGAGFSTVQAQFWSAGIQIEAEVATGSVAPTSFQLRIGIGIGGQGWGFHLNGHNGARLLGGAAGTTLSIE